MLTTNVIHKERFHKNVVALRGFDNIGALFNTVDFAFTGVTGWVRSLRPKAKKLGCAAMCQIVQGCDILCCSVVMVSLWLQYSWR